MGSTYTGVLLYFPLAYIQQQQPKMAELHKKVFILSILARQKMEDADTIDVKSTERTL